MDIDELFSGREQARLLFEAVRAAIEAAGPSRMQVSKSQIAFRRRRGFAWVWIPGRYLRYSNTAPLVFSLTLMSDGILDLLSEPTLKEKEAALPERVKAAGGSLDGLRQVFGLATLGEMPDDIALLVLSRNL